MACANVANVQLARGAARRKEIAVRMALGAHRFRLIRQLLAESLLTAASGGALGLALASWVVSCLATLPVMQAPGAPRLHMDGVVIAFVAALCVICTIISGLAPAWQITKATYLQASWASEYLLLRSSVDTVSLTMALRAALREIDPDQPLTEVETMRQRYSNALAGARLSTTLLVVFGAIALLLGSIGLYGIVSYSVSQRISEFALRMALGAKRHEIFGLVRNRAFSLVLMGGAIGLPIALCLSLLLRASLYGISPVSPITFSLVALVHVVVLSPPVCFPPGGRRRSNPWWPCAMNSGQPSVRVARPACRAYDHGQESDGARVF